MEKIAILRWESGHVPQGLMQLEQLPGNSTNLASYPFPVKLVEVKGANTDTVILHPSQKLLEDMIQLAKELEKEGVRAITTSCGFNAIFQEALANAVDIPVFTSSLLQVPFAQALVGRDRAVGVITASASSLSEKHLRACGITDEMHPIVMGLENAPEWSKIFDHPDDSFDMDLVTFYQRFCFDVTFDTGISPYYFTIFDTNGAKSGITATYVSDTFFNSYRSQYRLGNRNPPAFFTGYSIQSVDVVVSGAKNHNPVGCGRCAHNAFP